MTLFKDFIIRYIFILIYYLVVPFLFIQSLKKFQILDFDETDDFVSVE